MKRRTFAALSLLTLAVPLIAGSSQAQQKQKPAAPAGLPALSADEIVGKVQVVYDKLSTYKAAFKQRYTVEAYDKVKDSTGSVIFEKPGKMSWRYTSNGNRVVSDGKVIKIYEKANKQMYEQPLNKSQYPAALSFLTGTGNLKQNFKFTKQDSVQMKYSSGYVLLGEPLQPTAAYDKVYFYVDAKTFHVRRVIIQDAQRNRNRFDFEQPQANTKPPQGEFAFTPPPGTEIIKP
ncbi:MAG TPA: outer membrane lipoprotein carrier protein LolA [Polyangiaceae bacterium]|nr:outer membrane lipoprotein carrier protein LolA [Polyangiaceae bacterium]